MFSAETEHQVESHGITVATHRIPAGCEEGKERASATCLTRTTRCYPVEMGPRSDTSCSAAKRSTRIPSRSSTGVLSHKCSLSTRASAQRSTNTHAWWRVREESPCKFTFPQRQRHWAAVRRCPFPMFRPYMSYNHYNNTNIL
jgi:hypothetical protein